jgi:hypothetical protein
MGITDDDRDALAAWRITHDLAVRFWLLSNRELHRLHFVRWVHEHEADLRARGLITTPEPTTPPILAAGIDALIRATAPPRPAHDDGPRALVVLAHQPPWYRHEGD